MPTKKPTVSKSSTEVTTNPVAKVKLDEKSVSALEKKPAKATESSTKAGKPVKKAATKIAQPNKTVQSQQEASTVKAALSITDKKVPSKDLMTTESDTNELINPATSSVVAKSTVSTNGIAPYQEKPGEEYMNSEQLTHFRQILLHWKRQLMEEVDRTVHHMQDEAANFPDPNDRATQEEEFSIELRTRDRERKLIKKIEEALQKIESHDYGFCEACGIEIGIRRLEARPTATLCIDCKTIDEIKERQMGGHF